MADENVEALRSTAGVLSRLGHEVRSYAVSIGEAAERIAGEDPELSVVVVHHDDEHALDLIDELSECARGPVIVLLEGDHGGFLTEAAQRGVAAFARTDDPGEVQGAIDVAMRRHAERAELTEQVEQLSTALERRTVIERAKGILMERHGVDERSAFALLRDHARRRNRTALDVARAVVEGHGLLPKDGD